MHRWLLVALFCALVLELISRVTQRVGNEPTLMPEFLSIGSVTLACCSTVLLAIRTSSSRIAKSFMLLAAGAVSISVILHIIPGTPLLGSQQGLIISLADIIGIGAWMFGFFWIVFELQDAKSNLLQHQDRLVSEIADREKAERLVRESEARFRSVFDRAGISIMIISHDGTIIECNQAVGEESGYSLRQLHGTDLLSLVDEEDRALVGTELEKLREGESESRQFEHRLIRKDESPLWYNTTATSIQFDSDKPGIVVALMENISARRLRVQQMQQRQKMESLGTLAGGIAHDFNNLLVGIMSNAELLCDSTADPEQNSACNDIVQSAQNAATLCHQLLAYAGKAPKVEQALNLTELVLNSEELLRAALGRQATLELRCAPVLPAIKGDPSQIRQIVLNLIANAADALEGEGGSVQIATGVAKLDVGDFATLIHEGPAEAGTYAYLSITDAGSGIAEETVPKVFDPFYTTKQLGTGLGLAAVAGIVRAHRGMISIQSRPGTGTTVQVFFAPVDGEAEPVQQAQMQAPIPSLGAAPQNPPKKAPREQGGIVLVVDDEEKVRDAARRVLEHYGYDVLMAVDGQDGVEVFEKHHTQLIAVLLDLTMPRMNGETAFLKMQQLNPNIPIILSSGYSENEGSHRALVDKVAGYIRKPYRIQQLVDKLREVT